MSRWIFVIAILGALPEASAQPEGFDGVVAIEKWTVLHQLNARQKPSGPLPAAAKVKSLKELAFTGPKPGHPFVLGNYAAEGEWGLVNGYLQKIKGDEPALQLCWADQFELEGIAEHADFGGWYLLVGWADGHGYSISNVNFKTSGSPWFVSEMRGAKSIEDKTVEHDHFNWKGEQPFLLSVKENELTLKVGRFEALKAPLENYKPGLVILGLYNTDYGAKPIRIKSLRVRTIVGEKVKSE